MRQISLSSYILMYAGLIPFLFGAYLYQTQETSLWADLPVENWFPAYCLIIGSFMSGIHWGQHLSDDISWPTPLAILSNIIVLTFWFTYIFTDVYLFFITTIILFCAILGIDWRLYTEETISKEYFYNRCIVTILVITSLLIITL